MLFNLQVLRGISALGVVFYHTDFRLPGDWHTEFFGVPTFFVISGFIMCFITRENADRFLLKRVERIVPIYWVCTLALMFVMFRFRIIYPSTWLDIPPWRPIEPMWSYVLGSLLFLPRENPPILGVGWTLNFEIYFYLVFAAVLLISRRLAPLLAATVLFAVIWMDRTGYATGRSGFLLHYYSHGYIPYFLYGIALYYVWAFASPYLPRWPTVVLGVFVIVTLYGSQFVQPWWTANVAPHLGWYIVSGTPAFIVASVLFMESAGAKMTWPPLVLMGDASYSIYLTHTIWMETARPYIRDWHLPVAKESTVMMLFIVGTSIAIGIAVHLFVEKPMLRYIRGRVARTGKIRDDQSLQQPAVQPAS